VGRAFYTKKEHGEKELESRIKNSSSSTVNLRPRTKEVKKEN